MTCILVTGALGQIGTELVPLLENHNHKVIASDIRDAPLAFQKNRIFELLDVTNFADIERIINKYDVSWVVHNAAILSVRGEMNPQFTLNINNKGTENMLEAARQFNLRLYIPSSIAAFGPSTPKNNTPDLTIMQPTTMYGITKLYAELLGEYYYNKYHVDFRSLRYPGIISSEALPGGGTTDYAVTIFYEAIKKKSYTIFLEKDESLPMMYMPDCLRATAEILEAPEDNLTQRIYNVGGGDNMSFTPLDIAESIMKYIPEFKVKYMPDYRQQIAETWPDSLDDSKARADWGWKPKYSLDMMTIDMIDKLNKKLN